MRARAAGIAFLGALIALLLVAPVEAQFQPPSERMFINAQDAWTWSEGPTNVVQLEGAVEIDTDYAKISADRAVIWLTPAAGGAREQQHAEIALLGNARIQQGRIRRTGDRLFATINIRGTIRITAERRAAQARRATETYRQAVAIRPQFDPTGERGGAADLPIQRAWMTPPSAAPQPAPQPTTRPLRPDERMNLRAGESQTVSQQGKVALVLSGGIYLSQRRANGDFIELEADRAVLFTPLRSLRELGEGREIRAVEDAIEAAYLEGDVRIVFTPRGLPSSDQRLAAERVYYEFTTDRAVLTDAVIHTVEPQRRIPIIIRANVIRQLSLGEYRTQDVELSTSEFATPSYSVRADRAYVRQQDTGDPRLGRRTTFSATNATVRAFDVPFFYLPLIGGSVTEHGIPLRSIEVGNNGRLGTFVRTEWGLFETLGQPPPRDLDLTYSLDYLGDRGPAAGISGDYRGGFVSETSKQPWNFDGNFDVWGLHDRGEDHLGRRRLRVDPDEDFRWRVLWEHQHFFPQDWQAQVRVGLVSDPTFLEEFFEREFDEGRPHDVSIYLKRQRDTEAFYILGVLQPNEFVTTADLLQEQLEVERLPEFGFHRIGDGIWDDKLTFTSLNTFSALHFQTSDATLAEQGFRAIDSPGLASLGTTGVTSDVVYRADLRQEIAYPLDIGRIRALPYILGRLTPYSDTPDDSNETRVLAGAGVRFTTAFWKIDDRAQSRFFDIHRIRHIIEPEVHLFASVMNTERDDVFVYDEPIDAINDISGVQFALRQRWQTKRGGAGRWRNVDFLRLNIEANFFGNQPDDAFLAPRVFRGLFFASLPEASIPRNALNADAMWRVSDTTALLGDVQYNLDENTLATGAVGLAVQRDTRTSYFLGARYIGEINSTIGSANIAYELSAKYTLTAGQSFNFSESRNENSSLGVIRRFDRFLMSFAVYYDANEEISGVRFGVVPYGLGFGVSSQQLSSVFGPDR